MDSNDDIITIADKDPPPSSQIGGRRGDPYLKHSEHQSKISDRGKEGGSLFEGGFLLTIVLIYTILCRPVRARCAVSWDQQAGGWGHVARGLSGRLRACHIKRFGEHRPVPATGGGDPGCAHAPHASLGTWIAGILYTTP